MGDMASKNADQNKNYYEILQVNPTANAEVIHAAYRTLMSSLKKHPDLGGDADEARTINEAYDTLRDPVKRSNYDDRMKADRARGGVATSRVAWVEDDERRRVPRRYTDVPVNLCVGHDHRWFKGKALDVSILGMRLQSERPMRIGQMITIVGQNSTAQAIHAKVRWARMFHPSIFERVYEFGVEFVEPVEDIDQSLQI
jgi:curved DNA-binding protein CbpA